VPFSPATPLVVSSGVQQVSSSGAWSVFSSFGPHILALHHLSSSLLSPPETNSLFLPLCRQVALLPLLRSTNLGHILSRLRSCRTVPVEADRGSVQGQARWLINGLRSPSPSRIGLPGASCWRRVCLRLDLGAPAPLRVLKRPQPVLPSRFQQTLTALHQVPVRLGLRPPRGT
jgi:hypothetical protein